jgi:hypothetical protein
MASLEKERTLSVIQEQECSDSSIPELSSRKPVNRPQFNRITRRK